MLFSSKAVLQIVRRATKEMACGVEYTGLHHLFGRRRSCRSCEPACSGAEAREAAEVAEEAAAAAAEGRAFHSQLLNAQSSIRVE